MYISNIPFWHDPPAEDDPRRASSLFDRYRVSFWRYLGYRRSVLTTQLVSLIAATSHRPNNQEGPRSSNPESSNLSQRNFGARTTGGDGILSTSSSNITAWSILLGYPSIRNLLLPWVFDALILAFSKLKVNCAGMMTELWMLSLMKVANGEFSWWISSRRRSSTDRCWKPRSWASLAHWVPFLTPGPSVT